jgi:hypothetical protein
MEVVRFRVNYLFMYYIYLFLKDFGPFPGHGLHYLFIHLFIAYLKILAVPIAICVVLTTHPLLAPRSRNSSAIPVPTL